MNQDLKEVLRMTVMANQSIEIERLKVVMAIIPKIKFRAFRDSMGKLM